METVKQKAIQAISKLPETTTMDEIMYHLYVIDKVRKAQESVKRGEVISIDELKQEMEKW